MGVATVLVGKGASTVRGRRVVMTVGFAFHMLVYLVLLCCNIERVQCNASGCLEGMTGSCFFIPNNTESADFPLDCRTRSVPCAMCETATICHSGWHECDVIEGSGHPSVKTLLLLALVTGAFAVGDAVWESQVPALLQSYFSHNEDDLNAAITNQKLMQSVGFMVEFLLSLNGGPLSGSLSNVAWVAVALLVMSGVSLSIALRHVDFASARQV